MNKSQQADPLPPGPSKTNSNKSSKQKERNKRKKEKYKQKKKNKTRKTTDKPPQHSKPRTKKQWTWKILRSDQIKLQQKRTLFTINKLYNLKEQNQAIIYNLQSCLFTSTFKNKESIITTSIKSTSENIHSFQHSIQELKTDNLNLDKRISSIKRHTNGIFNTTIKKITQLNRNHGSSFKKRIDNLRTQQRSFNTFLQHRHNLQPDNLSDILQAQETSQRKLKLEQEKDKLQTTDKIHSFTNVNLPPTFKNLLNKGTNFIPTLQQSNHNFIKNTITEEVNQALCSLIKKQNINSCTRKLKSSKSNHRYKPYPSTHPHTLLKQEQSRPHFNIHIVDYVHNTTSYTKQYLQTTNLHTLSHPHHTNITTDQSTYIHQLQNNNDLILTKTDKNMGWALVPISWFQTEYERHFSDKETYQRIDNFNLTTTIDNSNFLLNKLKARFKTQFLTELYKERLLYNKKEKNLQIPYMKLLPKVHKLNNTASTTNIDKLTGRPIITAHSWITSDPSRLLGQELDNIILQLKTIFTTNNIPFPLVYNSTELINKLQTVDIKDINDFQLTTFDFTSLYTNISYQNTIQAIITSCKLLNLPNLYRDYLLNLNNFINQRNYFRAGNFVYQQIKGVAMGSYHSRQIADLVLLLSEYNFYNNFNTTGIFIFCRYIDDGFMLTNKANTYILIANLCAAYPSQIPITFTSSNHSVNYLDLTISLNHHTIRYHQVHYHIFQKPHHKYMYPHYSSNHPQHIFSGIIKTETVRYSRLSKTIDDYNYIHNLFRLRLNALDYPDKLITDNSFPWLPFTAHNRRNRTQHTKTKSTVYYRTIYNKHLRTDKIVQQILRKYHNLRIPKLSKAYCNTTKLHTMLLTNKSLHNKLSLHTTST